MNRHSARFARIAGGALVATVIAPWLGGGLAFAGASKPAPPSGDERATSFSGNVTTCAQIGLGDDTLIGGGTGDFTADGYDIQSDGTNLTVNAVADGQQIDALVVKGGDGYNIYAASVFAQLPVSGLHAPLVGNPPDNVPTISHWFACTGPADENPPPVFVAPTGTVTGDCDNATVDVAAGSDDTTFVIDHDGTTQQDEVAAGNGDEVVIPWSGDSTVSVSVLDGEGTLDTADRDSAACDNVEPVTNPAVSFANACKTGISVTLSNMNLDDTTNDDVTFTVVSPRGKTKHVNVRADQLVKLVFPVVEDTTATVTVSAPGLSATSHSFKKDCAAVLGEKVVKPPAVQGEQEQLPFTGLPASVAAYVAGLMLAVGGALTALGRRRSGERSAS